MNSLNKVKSFLDNCSLKDRMFYTIVGICTIESGFAFISAVMAELNFWATTGTLLCMLFSGIIIFYTVKSRNVVRGSILTCAAIALLLPYNYIVSGGMNGGMPMYFVCGAVLIDILLPKGKQGFYTVVYLVLCSLFFAYEYYHPEAILHYISRESQVADIIMSFWITSILMCWCISELLRGYEQEHLKTLQLNNQLKEMAIYDSLTEIYNRGHLMMLLDRMVNESAASGKKLTVVMFDIDFFKKVNDSCGHLAGDKVLHDVAAILKNNTVEYGFVGRYGGEEFIAVLSDMSDDAVWLLADKIRKDVDVMIRAGELNVTISGGIAQLADGVDNINRLIAVADANLYKAKQNGRNQIVR